MLNFDKLMSLVENSTAMNEQYEDAYPEMSMLEAAAYLPAMITESQLELAESVNEQTEQVMNIMTESADPKGDLESLTEASLQGIKDRILGFLRKVKEVVTSIINKIAQFISVIFMSNKSLLNKYGKMIDTAKCSGLKFKGYKFDDSVLGLDPGPFIDKYAPTDDVIGNAMTSAGTFNSFKDFNKKEIRAKMVKELTGMDLDKAEGSWANEYVKAVMGEKVEMTYGTDPFSFSYVSSIMKDSKMLKNLKDDYGKILKDAKKKEAAITKAKFETKTKSFTEKNAEDRETYSNAHTILTTWLQAYQAAYNAVSQAKNAELKIARTIQSQAKAMFAKMLKASTGKSVSSDSKVDSGNAEDNEYIIVDEQ